MKRRRPEAPDGIDPAAMDILFRRYWSRTGWANGSIAPAEFAHAKSAGLMFEPIDTVHDATIEGALLIRDRTDPREVADAFLASCRLTDWTGVRP
jgi:hypothetical protein